MEPRIVVGLGRALVAAVALELLLLLSGFFGVRLLPGMSGLAVLVYLFVPVVALAVAALVAWLRLPRPRAARWVGVAAALSIVLHAPLTALLWFAVKGIAGAV